LPTCDTLPDATVVAALAIGLTGGYHASGGGLDPTLEDSDFPAAVALQPDGKLVLIGFSGAGCIAVRRPVLALHTLTRAPRPETERRHISPQ